MNRRSAVVAVLAFLSFAFAAFPADAKPLPANSIILKAGGYFPQDTDLDFAGSGFNGEIAVNHLVAPGFAIEGGVGYFETKGDFTRFATYVQRKFKVVPLTFSLKGQTYFQEFEPYVEAGVGVYFIEDELTESEPFLGVTTTDSGHDTQVGFHVGLGGNYNVTRRLFLGLEGKYFWVKSDAHQAAMRLDAITLTGNVGFRF